MRLRTKIGSFVAAVCVVGAIGAAPANAGTSGFDISSIGSLCKSVKDPKLSKLCTDATAKLDSGKSGRFSSLLDKYSKLSDPRIDKLISNYTGGGFDISSLLGGFDISKIISGLKF